MGRLPLAPPTGPPIVSFVIHSVSINAEPLPPRNPVAEEIPHPKRNIPKGIAAQLIVGFLTTFIFYIALLYAITSLDDVLSSPIVELPLAAIYLQATNSRAGTTGLLVIFLINLL